MGFHSIKVLYITNMSLKMLLLMLLIQVVLCQCKFIDDLYTERRLDDILENPFYRFTRTKTMPMCDSIKTTSNFKALQNVDCRPFPTLVKVEPNSKQVDELISPSFVILHRCSGDCYIPNQGYGCTTIKSETVNVHIKIGSKLERNCIVPMSNHTLCRCNCKQNANNCNPVTHEWNENRCSCVCKSHLKTACELKGKSHKWNDNNCSCGCAMVMCHNDPFGRAPDPNNNCKCNPGVSASS
ncbi:uncharacterized protein LOC110242093 [Exaiptasia diaphana]|uniref:Platelet-derived growth factor (PDGF) family profile domain-containing protein n=1 Tax=Exaiptasia diaphana TaxID=2652724 RepID=A0A913XFN8_EXADI|nr:uncharacterized protein LOC110242093 [Exaiptasia diaphana]KXJ26215.1 hypothetical protein AC249_AIPGENE3420 [Exaiptasia diaphana]